MRTPALSLVVVLVLTSVTACGPKRPPSSAVTPTTEIPASVLGADDLLEIRVFQEESLSGEFRVGGEGTIDFPLLGPLAIRGLTPSAVANLLEEKLAEGYLNTPHVTVTVLEFNSRKISVLGEVNEPGRYDYRDGMTLVEAIAEAGGTTEQAVLQTVQITRKAKDEQVRYDVAFRDITMGRSADFVLLPGDVVVVQESSVK